MPSGTDTTWIFLFATDTTLIYLDLMTATHRYCELPFFFLAPVLSHPKDIL